MLPSRQSVAVVGGGIVGLAHAWSAAKRGHQVTLFERDTHAEGASIRNFGMIWPIGQPPGELHHLALRSRAAWLEVARAANLWVRECGSLHLAHRTDEWAVLEEFASLAKQHGIACDLLSREQVGNRSPAANPQGLLGALWSPSELCVNPRQAIPLIRAWLVEQLGVRSQFATTVVEVADDELRSADGARWSFDRFIICSGADLQTLFPAVFAGSGLKRCKLQMLRTYAQASGWKLGPHLASGLTLRHYANFASCPGLAALKQRIARETPELDELGIHVMASQNDEGEVILGDSHEYDAAIEPFDKPRIDDLILRELRKVICLPDWSLAARWNGIYAKHPSQPIFHAQPQPGVHICVGTGGAGMTMSFGLAERFWENCS